MPVSKHSYDFVLASSTVSPDGQTWSAVGQGFFNGVQIVTFNVSIERVVPPAPAGGPLAFGNTSFTRGAGRSSVQGTLTDGGVNVATVQVAVQTDDMVGTTHDAEPTVTILDPSRIG